MLPCALRWRCRFAPSFGPRQLPGPLPAFFVRTHFLHFSSTTRWALPWCSVDKRGLVAPRSPGLRVFSALSPLLRQSAPRPQAGPHPAGGQVFFVPHIDMERQGVLEGETAGPAPQQGPLPGLGAALYLLSVRAELDRPGLIQGTRRSGSPSSSVLLRDTAAVGTVLPPR